MKKFLIALPVIFCLILSVCVPLVSFADSSYTFEGDPGDGVNPATLKYCPLDYFQTANNFQDGDYYFYATYARGSGVSTAYSGYVQVDEIESVEESNGIYTIILPDHQSGDYFTLAKYNNIDYDDVKRFSVKKIVVDTILNSVEFYESLTATNTNFPPFGGYLYHYSTNILSDNSGDDLVIETIPELSGEIDYKNFDYKGISLTDYPYFEFYVENKSSKYAYQYAFFILDKGEYIKYNSVGDASSGLIPEGETSPGLVYDDSVVNGQFFSNSPVFTYISDEWCYSSYQKSGLMDLVGAPILGLSPTAWHLVKPGEKKQVVIPWAQMKLVPGHEYDCLFLACKKDSSVTALKYNNYVVNYITDPIAYNHSKPYDAYRSTFTVKSATPYDPNVKYNNADGSVVYPYNPDGDNSKTFDNLYAKLDSNGEYVRVEGSFKDNNPHNTSGSSGSLGSSGISGSSGFVGDISVTSFSGMFSNVFGAVSMFMNYLPSSIMSIFIFGFSCVIVIAVIKAVK